MSFRAPKITMALVSLVIGVTSCSSGSEFTIPEVGVEVDGGTVTAVNGNLSCYSVNLRYDAEWDCSEEQLELATSYPSPPPNTGIAEPDPNVRNVELEPTTCQGLADLRRPLIKDQQRATLEQNRYRILADKCIEKRGVKYYQNGIEVSFCNPNPTPPGQNLGTGGTSFGSGYPSAPAPAPSDPGYAPPPSAPNGGGVPINGGSRGEGASEHSTTNTQVAGVDEADFIKNDAGYVYVLSVDGLHVIDAWPAEETHEIAHLRLPGQPRRLFLVEDKLVVYTRLSQTADNPYAPGVVPPSNQGCTYGYQCRFSAEPGLTLITVYDVADPAEPTMLQRYELSGSFIAARRVGPYVYTVVHDTGQVISIGVDLALEADSARQFERVYKERRQEADDAVDEAPNALFLPRVREVNEEGVETREIEACNDALAARAAQGGSFVSLVTFDLEELERPTRTIAAAKPGFVYASESALYLTSDGVDGSDHIYYQAPALVEESTIHKFALLGVNTSYRGSAPVRGHVLNQFAMDELDGVLRVATSNGWVPDPNVSSNLTTFASQGEAFLELGWIGGIAPTEDIRAVRFDGTRGFVVTFKKTDPLFVFDLSVPETPTILGELKIPGFSTYMHPMDENHLLAIGFDADDQGSFAYFDGIQLQIFDVSDLSNPLLMHKTTVGTRGSGSEALLNHLAFNYFPQRGVMALPMTICEGGDNGVYGQTLTFSGLMVFDVSLETGIVEHGRLPFVDPAETGIYGNAGAGCGQWWTNATSLVKRSIFMDDYAIGISDTWYKVASLANLSNPLQTLSLVAEE